MDSGVSALLGAVIGGVFSILATLYANRKTQSSEHNKWIRDKKAELYSKLLVIAREMLATDEEAANQAINQFGPNLFELNIFTEGPDWNHINEAYHLILKARDAQKRDGKTLDENERASMAIRLQAEIVASARNDLIENN